MFSVVMPLWNKRATLAASVASVLAQNWPDFELIIVDDGSTDRGLDTLNKLTDPRIRLLPQQNAGPGAARNAGMAAARHSWFAFIDADDLWSPGHLDELDRIRRAFPNAGLIGTRFTPCVDLEVTPPTIVGDGRIECIDYFRRAASAVRPFCTSTSAVPRCTFERLGGFGSAPWGQDAEYWARIALERPIAVSDRPTAHYRLASGGITDRLARSGMGPIHSLRDVGPSVALLLDRYADIDCPDRRRAVDAYIRWRTGACIRRSAMSGDLRALRSLSRLHLAGGATERSILILAGLPAALARAMFRLGYAALQSIRSLAEAARHLWRKMAAIPAQRVAEQPARQQLLDRTGH